MTQTVPMGQLALSLSPLTIVTEPVNQRNKASSRTPLSSKFAFFFVPLLPPKADDEACSTVVRWMTGS